MSKGVLLFCFDTQDTRYHKILERCVKLINKNIGMEITVVTDFATYQQMSPMGFINYKFIEPELGNKLNGRAWNNVDRHLAYELSPYDTTLVMDIDYFCFSDNLKQLFDTRLRFPCARHSTRSHGQEHVRPEAVEHDTHGVGNCATVQEKRKSQEDI